MQDSLKSLIISSETLIAVDGNVVRCLYVSNIPNDSQSDDLLNLCSVFGIVKNFYLKKANGNKQTTFAFVTFETPEQAYRMFKARNKLRFSNRKLYISVADTWHQPVVRPDGSINYNPGVSATATVDQKNKDEGEQDEDEEEETQVVNNVEDCPIAKLNDDCLLLIFKFIPFAQLHTISHICQRWRNLMMSYWSKITTLNFSNPPFNLITFSDKNLDLYLRMCTNITTVHLTGSDNCIFSSQYTDPTSKSIMKVARLCRNLENLTLQAIDLSDRPLASVAHFCRNLKALTLISCPFSVRDDEMNSVVKKCAKLESIKIVKCELQPGFWMKYLRPGMKSLSFQFCQMNHVNFVEGLGRIKESLEELELVEDVGPNRIDFMKLQELFRLEKSANHLGKNALEETAPPYMFQNLTRLELIYNNFLTDDSLEGLVRYSPQLRQLNLAKSKSSRLSPSGFNVLSDLIKLEKLNVSLNCITDKLLLGLSKKAKNLEILAANSCPMITDVGCSSIVKSLMKLKEFHIDNCKGLSCEIIEVAAEAATANEDKEKLIIFCGETELATNYLKTHDKVELHTKCRDPYRWLLSCNMPDSNSSFLQDDDLDDDEEYDDDDDYYDEDDQNFDFYDDNEDLDEIEAEIDWDEFGLDNFRTFNIKLNFF